MNDKFDILYEEIRALRDEIKELRKEMSFCSRSCVSERVEVVKDISALKVKASVWGALGGIIVGIATYLFGTHR